MVVKRPNAENIDNYMVIQNALSAGNIKSIDVSFLYYDDDYPKENVPYMPLRTFCNIININPKGKIIKKK